MLLPLAVLALAASALAVPTHIAGLPHEDESPWIRAAADTLSRLNDLNRLYLSWGNIPPPAPAGLLGGLGLGGLGGFGGFGGLGGLGGLLPPPIASLVPAGGLILATNPNGTVTTYQITLTPISTVPVSSFIASGGKPGVDTTATSTVTPAAPVSSAASPDVTPRTGEHTTAGATGADIGDHPAVVPGEAEELIRA